MSRHTANERPLDYHAARAREEAVRAISSGKRAAAAVHQELCLLHCGRMVAELIARR